MKKILLVGLLVGSQVHCSSDKFKNLSVNVEEAVNNAFKTACKPENYDDLCSLLKVDKNKLPSVTQIAVPYKIIIDENSSEITILKDGKILTGNECIQVWNVAREAIYEARKNRKPEMSRLEFTRETISIVVDVLIMVTGGKVDRKDRGSRCNRWEYLDAAWQANSNKISPATDEVLKDCSQVIVDSNYALNPTWENWALTKGINGQRLVGSVVLLTAGAAKSYASKSGTGSRAVGDIGILLGGVGLSLSFDTDHLKFSLKPELDKK